MSIINNSLAPEYSSDSIYAASDRVSYNGKLYLCLVDVTTPEEFDETKWKRCYIGDELNKEMREQLGGLSFVKLTQAEYDALETKNANTLYIIVG